MALPRVRTAQQAAEEIRKIDPQSKIRESHIRYLMKSGEVPIIQAGCRMFVNLDILLQYLESDRFQVLSMPKATQSTAKGIRRIEA